MMKSSRLKKDKIENNVNKGVRSLFQLKKEINDKTFKYIRSHFRLKKENEAIKKRIIRDTLNLFEHEEEDY